MRLASVLCVAALGAACTVEPSVTTPETYADYLKLSKQLSCEATLRCCGRPCDPAGDAGFYASSLRILDYIQRGQLGYDKQMAIECLRAMKELYAGCDSALYLLQGKSCGKLLVPLAAPGAVCETGISVCAASGFCDAGRCAALPAAGQTCLQASSGQRLCANDSFCNTSTLVCMARGKVGQPCTNGCVPGTSCVTSVCTAQAELGSPCGLTGCNSQSGLVCLPSMVCGLPQPDGAPCTSRSHCLSDSCDLTQGVCQPQTAPLTVRQQLCPPPPTVDASLR